jgi:pilus assembly protein FimV
LANKKDAFQAYATQLANAGRRSDVEFWTTVKQMGSELCPESPLFSAQGAVKPLEKTVYVAKEAPSIALEPSKINLPIAIDAISVPSSVTEDTQEQQQSNSLEFDLSAVVLEQAEDELVNTPEFDQINLQVPLLKTNTNNPLQRDFYTHSVNQSNQDEEQTRFDLTDMDEMETKLDLAKAYIDMSDSDSAKEMIAEVIKKGTEQQRLIAQSLLKDVK